MKANRPRFWRSLPFLILTFFVLLFSLGFWVQSVPESISTEILASNPPIPSDAASFDIKMKGAPSASISADSIPGLEENAEKHPLELDPVSPLPIVLKTEETVKEHLLKKGESLSIILTKFGISDQEIFEITKSSKKVYDLKKIHPGQKIAVTFEAHPGQIPEMRKITTLSYEIDPLNFLEIKKSEGRFVATKHQIFLEKGITRRAGTISDTLYDSAKRFSVPVEVILDLSDIFAWDLDFGIDIRSGDHFNVVYEVFKKEDKVIRTGRIVAAEIVNRAKRYRAYYFAPEVERGDYYTEAGRSLRKAFLKSPLRYRYISSGYARRRLHPILKVNRPHLGIDFAARRGTPVRAAGDGVVSFVGWNGGHGKTVMIRHKNGYKTLYGHLSSFMRGIKKGKKVKQEDFIGRVGSTGLSTGPHLHYTLYKNGRAINPRKADVLRGEALSKKWMSAFSEQVEMMNQYLYPTSDLLLTSGY